MSVARRTEAVAEAIIQRRGLQVLSDAINDLKGFYTKTGQIIASRQDLFPKQYIDALAGLTDFTDPMPASLVRAVVEREW